MQKKYNEIIKNNRNEVKININDISTFLYKSGFLNKSINDTEKLILF